MMTNSNKAVSVVFPEAQNASSNDALVSDPAFASELDICLMTLWRWDHDPNLAEHLPPRIKIRNRNYRSRKAIETFKAWLLRSARGKGAA